MIRVARALPAVKNVLLTVLSAVMLIGAFPPFELWWLAWVAPAPLIFAIHRERSVPRSILLGWLFGIVFFIGTCWWLTYAPIYYAAFPPWLAYSLLFFAASGGAVFPAVFAGISAYFFRRFGSLGFAAVPFLWIFSEFLRYWLTGNNWNSIGYSQAFGSNVRVLASVGGIALVGFVPAAASALVAAVFASRKPQFALLAAPAVLIGISAIPFLSPPDLPPPGDNAVVAVQANVPMSGLTLEKWNALRQRHKSIAEDALRQIPTGTRATVIFPESPMNFMYSDDRGTQDFINGFTSDNNVSVIFNSAEPDPVSDKYFNSAVMVAPSAGEVAQYDKIYLLPFGEAVPSPFASVMPAFVGSFAYGSEYDLLPIGDAKAGIMICFESHFGQLGREYVDRGADVLIEMTNDGYLGPTPVLRQHLANAVFRAVETRRPLLRVTNVGITAYIAPSGDVLDAAGVYQEASRVWGANVSDGSRTFYVRFGDWFAWLCSAITAGLLVGGVATSRPRREERT